MAYMYALKPPLSSHADLFRRARALSFGLDELSFTSILVYASSKGSDEKCAGPSELWSLGNVKSSKIFYAGTKYFEKIKKYITFWLIEHKMLSEVLQCHRPLCITAVFVEFVTKNYLNTGLT